MPVTKEEFEGAKSFLQPLLLTAELQTPNTTNEVLLKGIFENWDFYTLINLFYECLIWSIEQRDCFREGSFWYFSFEEKQMAVYRRAFATILRFKDENFDRVYGGGDWALHEEFKEKVAKIQDYEYLLPRFTFSAGWTHNGYSEYTPHKNFHFIPFQHVVVRAPTLTGIPYPIEFLRSKPYASSIVLEYESEGGKGTFKGEKLFISAICALFTRFAPHLLRFTYEIPEHLKKNNLPIPFQNIVCYP